MGDANAPSAKIHEEENDESVATGEFNPALHA
jgi:hypothetical protein